MSKKTLRLNMPQWQGGNNPAYHLGSQILSFLAPQTNGPEETVDVDKPVDGSLLKEENGIVARSALVRQAKAARAAIDKHDPDRIVAIGGDCLIDLAPIAYLRERYGAGLGVLWIDSHPDVIGPDQYAHAHAHVLGALLGIGDPDLDAEVAQKVDPRKVMYAGMDSWMDSENEIIKRLNLRHTGSAALAETSQPILDWVRDENITHLAVHFDLDVLDPAFFRALLVHDPDAPEGAWDGVQWGKMRLHQVVRLLNDVAAQTDIVGLALAEHVPWDMIELRNALRALPLMQD